MFAQVVINRAALSHNITSLRSIIGPNVLLMSVVKANAYGHGLVETAPILARAGADWFGVIDLAEALQLREYGIKNPILVLGYTDEKDFGLADTHSISLTLPGRIDFTKITGLPKVHIKVDTGMSRLGIPVSDALLFIGEVIDAGLPIEGVFSHFANASDAAYSVIQSDKFQELRKQIIRSGLKPIFHLANTAATLTRPDTHFDLVRTGIGTYGLSPFSEMPRFALASLIPALSFSTKIVHIKKIQRGTFVGYGCTFKADKDMTIAVIGVGYAEGFDRGLTNSGEVLISGKRCLILGRVCMNQTIVDVTNFPNVKLCDEVVLIGRQWSEEITADEIASKIGTVNYEVVTRIPSHIPRFYQ